VRHESLCQMACELGSAGYDSSGTEDGSFFITRLFCRTGPEPEDACLWVWLEWGARIQRSKLTPHPMRTRAGLALDHVFTKRCQ
jgi:hypothetical protein